MKCRFCNNETALFLDMRHIPVSVTSDCRVVNIGFALYKCNNCSLIQKDSNIDVQQNYFNEFKSFSLSFGQEQVKFIDSVPYPRSQLILNSLKEYIPQKGSILDIGTGSGSFLRSFQKLFSLWHLYAQDIQANSLQNLLEITDKDKIHIGEIKEIDEKFDLISLIHVLGHIAHLREFLSDLKRLSHTDSKLIIQTPDLESGFFDVVIIDQINHFSASSLKNIVSCEFEDISFFNALDRELTLGINIKERNARNIVGFEKEIEKKKESFRDFIEYLHVSKESFAVLGSAPASTYIAAVLKNRALYFVDEDKTKTGKIHLNKEIKSLRDVKKEKIILPFLQKDIIEDIKGRNPSLNFISYMDIVI